jgi:hypothetical protein
MYISYYVPRGFDLAKEHNGPPYVPQPTNEHKLRISVFKQKNIF